MSTEQTTKSKRELCAEEVNEVLLKYSMALRPVLQLEEVQTETPQTEPSESEVSETEAVEDKADVENE